MLAAHAPGIAATLQDSGSPRSVARRAARSFAAHAPAFFNWEGGWTYGPAIAIDGIYRTASLLGDSEAAAWTELASAYLDAYALAPGSNGVLPCDQRLPYGKASDAFRGCAHVIMNASKRTMAWEKFPLGTIGDSLGVFPIAYLARREHAQAVGNASAEDLAIAVRTAAEYIVPYPFHLPDGTFARTGGCCAPPPASHAVAPHAPPPIAADPSAAPLLTARHLWADDQYMGLSVISRLAVLPERPLKERLAHAQLAGEMLLRFSSYLRDPADGLLAHGAYLEPGAAAAQKRTAANPLAQSEGQGEAATLAAGWLPAVRRSCCKWGRANGWGAMAHVEVLSALWAPPTRAALRPLGDSVARDLAVTVDAMLPMQDQASGMWRQVIGKA